MAETMGLDSIQEFTPAVLETTSFERAVRPRTVKAVTRRQRDEHWCSALGDEELGLLLRVIENQLLPSLLSRFTPEQCGRVDSRVRDTS